VFCWRLELHDHQLVYVVGNISVGEIVPYLWSFICFASPFPAVFFHCENGNLGVIDCYLAKPAPCLGGALVSFPPIFSPGFLFTVCLLSPSWLEYWSGRLKCRVRTSSAVAEPLFLVMGLSKTSTIGKGSTTAVSHVTYPFTHSGCIFFLVIFRVLEKLTT